MYLKKNTHLSRFCYFNSDEVKASLINTTLKFTNLLCKSNSCFWSNTVDSIFKGVLDSVIQQFSSIREDKKSWKPIFFTVSFNLHLSENKICELWFLRFYTDSNSSCLVRNLQYIKLDSNNRSPLAH